MHSQVMIQEQVKEDEREKDHAVRLAKLAGVSDAEDRIDPELTATVRFGDPNLAELFRKQARNDLVEEALLALEGSGAAPKRRSNKAATPVPDGG